MLHAPFGDIHQSQFRGRANDKNWMNHSVWGNYSPSTRRELGGEIIDDAGISTTIGHDGQWVAYNAYNLNDEKRFMHCDKSRLVAAMRTFVESNAGPEIEVPQSVTQ